MPQEHNAAKKESNPRICFDRVIPDELQMRYAMSRQALMESALRHHKRKNGRELFHDLDPTQPIDAPRMALINSKKWPTGSTLKCRFLDGTKTQQDKVVEQAHSWQQYANIKIDFVTSQDEQVRIAFTPGQGSWSAVGTDSLNTTYFPKHHPTMNYGWLTDHTDETEYRRVVVHEFGHALGCIHEHQSPNEHLNWDAHAVYTYFSGSPNYWSKGQIDQNVLQKYSGNGMSATVFDEHSIMLYQFPDYLFTDHRGTPTNTHISEKDKQLIAQMYPKM
jgi:hypothetical protein